MNFGVYIHFPYCVQRCSYCDFATFEQSKLPPKEHYLSLLKEEIRLRSPSIPHRIGSLYLGGGTPSLFQPDDILSLIESLANCGFEFDPKTEKTLEMNPGTLTDEALRRFEKIGLNRFSVGFQTSSVSHLKRVGRIHSVEESRALLAYLRDHDLNFNADLLFALPGQTLQEVEMDLQTLVEYRPNHISPYCLTLSQTHHLSSQLPSEELQLSMFELIDSFLISKGYHQYEISNYALPGFESRHNLLYWEDQPYWGIGLGAHSYLRKTPWGLRFWNPSTFSGYEDAIATLQAASNVPSQLDHVEGFPVVEGSFEILQKHHALTDFCHTSLRTSRGLDVDALSLKFGKECSIKVLETLASLESQNLVIRKDPRWKLSRQGQMISNLVFKHLTFLAEDLEDPSIERR